MLNCFLFLQLSIFRRTFAIPKRKTNVFEWTATAGAVKTKHYEEGCFQTFCRECETAQRAIAKKRKNVLPYIIPKATAKKVRGD